MKTIDTRGQLCPKPLIMTKKCLSSANIGEGITIISDNDTAKCNLITYLTELGYVPQLSTVGNEFRIEFTVTKNLASVPDTTLDEISTLCPVETDSRLRKGYTLVIKSQEMGYGDPQLGNILIRALINSMTDADRLPETIIFYNSGVLLTTSNSDTIESLRALESAGCKIIICGTCADFYGIKDKVAVGSISNMFTIYSILSESGCVVYP